MPVVLLPSVAFKPVDRYTRAPCCRVTLSIQACVPTSGFVGPTAYPPSESRSGRCVLNAALGTQAETAGYGSFIAVETCSVLVATK